MYGIREKKCNNFPLPELSVPRWRRFHNGNMHRHVCNYVFQPCANVRNSACSGPSTQIWRARARRAFKRTTYTSLSTVIVRSVLYESAYCVEVRSYARLHNSLWLPDMSGNTRRPQLSLYARERIRHLLSGGLNSSQVVEA